MPDADPASGKTPLWRNLSFTLMWTSTAASGYGDRMIMLGALAMLGGLAENSDSSAIQASTQFWFFLPYLVFNLFGGWLADHLPRKWLLLGCDESRGLILLGSVIALAGLTGSAQLPEGHAWKVWATLAAIGTFAAIFNPTRNAIVPQIVKPNQLQSANAVILVINVVASMVGFVIGSRLIKPDSIDSVQTGLLMGALFYLVSGMFFAFMKPAAPVDANTASNRSMGQAVSYARVHRRVWILILVNVLVWASAAAVSTGILGVLRVHHGLSGKPLLEQFGIMFPLLGVGMLVGAVVIILIQTRRESTLVLTAALFGAGVCTLVLGLVPVMWVAYVSCFGVGLFGNIAIISALTVLQSICPNYIRGRIMGLNAMINTIFSVVVYGAIWQMPNADKGVVASMSIIGPMLILGGIIGMLRYLQSGPMPNRLANAFWRITRLFCYSWHRLSVTGKHHVPGEGPTLIVANHTTAMDPFLIQSSCVRMVRWLMLTSYRMKIAEPLWRAIDPICIEHDKKTGTAKSGTKQVRQIVAELKKGDAVGMFPEGHLQYDNREMKPFEDGAAVMARLSKCQIVPCWIDGTVLSKRMLMHVLKPTHSTVTFGPPFTPDPGMSVEELTAEIRRRIVDAGRRSAFSVAGCPSCGYDLRGMFEGGLDACPECGHVIFAQPAGTLS
ncbi:MFS transporter [Phycisphaeraceae bacterium D3-23]